MAKALLPIPVTNPDTIESIDIAGVASLFAGPFGFAASERAIPDVRDGLIPVRRRILYTAAESHLWADGDTRKAAELVGNVMGKYHPHGDSSIYGAVINMAQEWDTRYPLIEVQGNQGSPDGDPPAAMRYTEVKLTAIGEQIVRDLENPGANVVDWGRNYAENTDEPELLPMRFPVLLANGTNGIGWGSASLILPHNLRELLEACCALLDDPKLPVAKLAKLLPGPDFPSGGIIVGNDDWEQILETGRGKIVLRGKIHVEQDGKRTKLVITEMPYQVQRGHKDNDKPGLEGKIHDLIEGDDKKKGGPLAGIVAEVRNESSEETRLVLVLENGVSPERATNALFRETDLQSNYGVNQVVSVPIAHGIAISETLGTRDLINRYLAFQLDVLTRRYTYWLKRDKAELLIAKAKVIAHTNVDEVIKIIRASDSAADGQAALMKRFNLEKIQAETIWQMPTGTFAKLSIKSLNERIATLEPLIKEYERLLASKPAMADQLKREIKEIKDKFGDDRRSVIDSDASFVLPSADELIPDEPCWLTLSSAGLVARNQISAFKSARRGTAGVQSAAKPEEDPLVQVVSARTRDRLWLLTDLGNLFATKISDIEEVTRGSRGTNVHRFLGLTDVERPVKLLPLPSGGEVGELTGELVIATALGKIKRSKLSEYGNINAAGLRTLVLNDGDAIVSAFVARTGQHIMSVSSDGYALRFDIDDVPIQGRVAQGVASQSIGRAARVITSCAVEAQDKRDLAVVFSNGRGKRSALKDYPQKGRSSRGVLTADFTSGKGPATISFAGVVADEDLVFFTTSSGKAIVMGGLEIKRQGRATAGVITVGLSGSGKSAETVTGGTVATAVVEERSGPNGNGHKPPAKADATKPAAKPAAPEAKTTPAKTAELATPTGKTIPAKPPAHPATTAPPPKK
jgi:DNA gyrase subunit A